MSNDENLHTIICAQIVHTYTFDCATGFLSLGRKSSDWCCSILLGSNYCVTSSFCGEPEQTTHDSPGLKMSTFSCWQKVPP